MTAQIDISLRVALRREPVVVEPAPVQLYRKPHDVEVISYDDKNWAYGGDGYRAGRVRGAVLSSGKPMPEVYRVQPDHQTPINCAWQKLWRGINPELSDEKWGTLLSNNLAWTNNTGFPGRYNCLTGSDFDQELPRFHAPIINGGAVLKGKEVNGWLEIESLLIGNPVPKAEEVLSKPWLWFWGTSVTKDGSINLITRLGTDGRFHPVRVPILTREPVRFPLTWLHKLPLGAPVPDVRSMA
jgi:hypothetical protein